MSKGLSEGASLPRVRAERQAATLDAILTASPDLVYLCGRSGEFLYANPSGAAVWGLDRSELVGRTWRDLGVPPDVVTAFDVQRGQVLESGQVIADGVSLTTRHGERVYEYRLTPYRDDGIDVEAVVFTLRDCTEQRRAEEAVRESEEKYRLLAENSTDMISRHDPAGVYLYASPACRRLLGYEPEELVGRSAYDLIHPDDHDWVAQNHSALLTTSETFTVVFRIIRKDGAAIWFETTTRTVRNPWTGEVVEIHCSSRDISTRKEAEEALRASEQRFRTFVDHATDAFFLFDDRGVVLDVNRQACQILGYTRDELVGKTPFDFDPDVTSAMIEALGRRLDAGETVAFDTRHRRKDGSVFPVEVRGRPFWEGGRRLTLTLVRDITERKKAEDALRESEERFRGAFDAAAVGIGMVDPSGRLLRVNTAFCEILGYSEAELLGLTFQEITHPEDLAADLRQYQRLLTGEIDAYRIEKRYLHKEGHFVWALLSVSIVRGALGEPLYLVDLIEDITRRRRAEEQLREQNSRLEALIRSERQAHQTLKQAECQLVQAEKLTALGQLVAGVAHEINNPLAFVVNNVAVLQRDARLVRELLTLYRRGEDALATTAPDLLARIRALSERIDLDYTLEGLERLTCRSSEGLRRIRQIVGDLRDFARLDEGAVNEADLNDGIRSTVNLISGRAKDRGVNLVLDLAPLPRVSCSPGKLNQVVLNLLANAIDASTAGGTVTVRTRAMAAGVEIHVSDDGRGIDPSIRDRIFDPFFTTKPVGQGTGLGLSLSYGIIHEHGGTIRVESSPDQGAHFTISLPLTRPIPSVPALAKRGGPLPNGSCQD